MESGIPAGLLAVAVKRFGIEGDLDKIITGAQFGGPEIRGHFRKEKAMSKIDTITRESWILANFPDYGFCAAMVKTVKRRDVQEIISREFT